MGRCRGNGTASEEAGEHRRGRSRDGDGGEGRGHRQVWATATASGCIPHDASQEEQLEQPEYESDKPIYYAAEYGNSSDRIHSFVLDESEGPGRGYDTFYIDANNDNRIDAEKERFKIRVGDPGKTHPIRIRLEVASGGATRPYSVSLTAFTYSDEKHVIPKIHANLRDSSYYLGEAEIDGERRLVAIADLDSNGMFNDVRPGCFTATSSSST